MRPYLKTSHFHSAREQMSPFYFKFQFRNVEYSSGRNKTLLCFRVDTPGGSTEPLSGYMEDEHTTAHAEEAFFQQVTCFSHWSCYIQNYFFSHVANVIVVYILKSIPRACCHFQVLPNPSLEYDITWYVSSSPCISCANTLAKILQQRKKVRLCIFCSRLFEWDQPEVVEALQTLVRAGCKLRMMKPSDFQHVWETYVEKEGENFTPWEDCQDNHNYYKEILADILK